MKNTEWIHEAYKGKMSRLQRSTLNYNIKKAKILYEMTGRRYYATTHGILSTSGKETK